MMQFRLPSSKTSSILLTYIADGVHPKSDTIRFLMPAPTIFIRVFIGWDSFFCYFCS